jgi:hypothetical protein
VSTDPYRMTSQQIDFADRMRVTATVVASPAAAAETIIAQTAAFAQVRSGQTVKLSGWVAYTVGTTGNTVRFRIRQTGLAGTVVGDTGALTGSQHGAGILSDDNVQGLDAAPASTGQVYVLTMQVGAATAVSTVSAVYLEAFAI